MYDDWSEVCDTFVKRVGRDHIGRRPGTMTATARGRMSILAILLLAIGGFFFVIEG